MSRRPCQVTAFMSAPLRGFTPGVPDGHALIPRERTAEVTRRDPHDCRLGGVRHLVVRSSREGAAMPSKSANVKNEKQYEALKDKGMSKQRAARIANSPGASSRGGKKSGSGGSSSQGGTTAQKKAAGRKGGKAAAKSS